MSKTIYKHPDGTDLVLVKDTEEEVVFMTGCKNCYYNNHKGLILCPTHKKSSLSSNTTLKCVKKVFNKTEYFHFVKAF